MLERLLEELKSIRWWLVVPMILSLGFSIGFIICFA